MSTSSPSSSDPASLLCLRGIHKHFGPTHALRGVDLELTPGRALAVIGENGAGKSTLVKILTGVHQADAGDLLLDGRPLRLPDTHAAQAAGIVAVHQETVMFEELTAAENIFIGRQPQRGLAGLRVVDWAAMNRLAQQVLDQVGAGFAATTPVRQLSLAQRHLIEIARALSQQARVVILDEPTAALSQAEIRDFYAIVRGLLDRGVAVLFISHKFDELFAVCDQYVVLRDGASVGAGSMKAASEPELLRLMAGRSIEQVYPRVDTQPGPTVLQARDLSHATEFDGISFELRRGEILGFYGLVGAGRSEVMMALMGLKPLSRGSIAIDGQARRIADPADAIAMGLVYVPEERQRQGGILDFSVRHNLSLAALAGPGHAAKGRVSRGPWLSAVRESAWAQRLIERLHVKTDSQHTPLSRLSGGNQQKVVIGKWLGLDPRVVILDEPTKGIDVGAKQAVYRLVAEMVEQGMAVILVSSELSEVMNLAHRVIVMKRGRQVAEFGRGEADAETLVAAASGLSRNAA